MTENEVQIVSDLYNASLSYLNDQIGRLIDELRDWQLWDDSTVAFTADHGEQFREHGEMTHCSEPWEEGFHVPFVVRAGDDELTDIEEVTSTIGIAPTLPDAAFEDPDIPNKYHGISLLPAFHGVEKLSSDRIVFGQSASKTGREIYLDHRLTDARKVGGDISPRSTRQFRISCTI